MFEAKLFDELRQGQLPRLLLMVIKLAQLCRGRILALPRSNGASRFPVDPTKLRVRNFHVYT